MSLSRERGRRYNSGNDVLAEDKMQNERTDGSADFDHSTDKLKIHATTISEDSKKLHKFREKIRKKKKQSKSKNLETCKLTYKDTLESLKEEITELTDILYKRDRKLERTQSQRPQKKEARPEKCIDCKWKESRISTLENQLSQQHIPNQDQHRIQQLIKERDDAVERLNEVSKTHVPLQHFDELKQHNAWLDREIKSVRQQIQAEKAAKEDALRRLNDVPKTHVPVQSFNELKQQKALLDREIDSVRQQNQTDKAEKEDALRRLNNVSKTHAPLQHFDELRKQKAWQDREIENLRQQNQAEKAAKEEALRRLNEVSKTHVPLQHFEELKQQKAWLDREIESVRQQIQAEKAAKEDALRRLSTMASSKLRDNNPNITDLSDQNRPTKISEKMSELYDNQWTDAFDALEKQKMQEREIIYALLQSLMTAYHECHRLANEHFFETVQAAIECPRQGLQPSRYQVVMTDQLKQQIKEFRKIRAPKVIEEIEKIVKPRIPLASNRSQEVNSYLSKCVEIGWLMVVQDPPLVLVDKSTFGFDTNTFKDYTKRGRYIQYVVWPALYLHEKGPLLGKGVAQGCDVKPDQTRSLGRAVGKKTVGQNNRMLESCILQTSPKRPVVDERFFQAPVQENARSSTNV
ncbi:uncharacterized protein LOC123556778 [Mercenaria mercenaria]|uniref:uncharacterized protein LOC123556778 n=1 Tax=Mercenaria mercenaria TaxID=6596 RepID=UPI00234E8FE6|nr:uncharacterized protein LOC123556778 [Mercenaria mercenaria]